MVIDASSINRRVSVLAEWTNFCNLKCNMCPISQDSTRPRGHMSLGLWKEILDCCKREGHFVDWVHFFGEPLMWKHFFKGMELWRTSGLIKFGHISTNGHLLTDDKIECIADSGISYIRIGLDTLKPEVYRKLRGSINHNKLISNIKNFLRKAPKVHCQIQLLRSSHNLDESTRDIFRFFGWFKNFSVLVADCQSAGGDSSLSVCPNPAHYPNKCNKVNYEHCPITWDGKIGLCCLDYLLQNRLGDMSTGSISAVYLGEYAERVRSSIKARDFHLAPYCARCPMGHVGAKYNLVYADQILSFAKVLHYIHYPGETIRKLEKRLLVLVKPFHQNEKK